MTDNGRTLQNPSIVFREEFDDWALLYDPDTGLAYGLNPTGAILWKHLDGTRSIDDLVKVLSDQFDRISEETPAHVERFLDSLVETGLAGIKI